jgi:flagellin
MANIGTTTAFYKVESSLTRANNEVSKSMERLATGRQNANAGDRSSYVAMSDTFRLDFVGTKAGIKGASVAMGYLETGMRVLDAASGLLSRLQELAVLGANNTNTIADHEAINAEAEALGDEFNRLMTTSSYKGKNVFVSNAGSEYVSMGGRNAEMTFGIGTISYNELYASTGRLIAGGPNDAATVNLAHLPSDAVAAKKYGFSPGSVTSAVAGATLTANKQYIISTLGDASTATGKAANALVGAATKVVTTTDNTAISAGTNGIAAQDVIKVGTSDISVATGAGTNVYTEVTTDNAFVAGLKYEIVTVGSDIATSTANSDAAKIAAATTDITAGANVNLTVGQQFTVTSSANLEIMAELNSLTSGITFRRVTDASTKATAELTQDIEAVQAKINTARVQAGSQYAAMESAVDYTTDLTAQYELGFNTVNDVNFSMETAHLAKNQILQQAATAMLAQANQGQQGLLQLIQG